MPTTSATAGAASESFRPATAPGRPQQSSLEQQSNNNNAFASKDMPKGNVQLFRSNFLNTNAILLEYLAKSTLENKISGGGSHETLEQLRDDYKSERTRLARYYVSHTTSLGFGAYYTISVRCLVSWTSYGNQRV